MRAACMRESLKYTLYAVLRFSWGLYFVLCIQSGIETPMQLYNDQIIQITGSYLVLFIFGMFALLVQFMNRKNTPAYASISTYLLTKMFIFASKFIVLIMLLKHYDNMHR